MFICNTLSSTPRQLLRIILHETINTTKNSTLRNFWGRQSINTQKQSVLEQSWLFPIKRLGNDYPVRYSSPIAHRLAANSTQSAAEIAQELVTQLLVARSQQLENCSHLSLPLEVLQGLIIQATATGYVQFDFSDQAIAEYLNALMQHLPHHPITPSPHPPLPLPRSLAATPQLHHRIFLLQHTHARCCSLLRLAHQNHFIQLNSQVPENQADRWQIVTPKPLSWVTTNLQFRTNHATELQWIAQIVTVLDALTDWGSDSHSSSDLSASAETDLMTLITTAEGLSQAFHASHCHWQLMGNLRTQECDRLQAHLGLVLITQRLLYHLLQDQLDMEAPVEL